MPSNQVYYASCIYMMYVVVRWVHIICIWLGVHYVLHLMYAQCKGIYNAFIGPTNKYHKIYILNTIKIPRCEYFLCAKHSAEITHHTQSWMLCAGCITIRLKLNWLMLPVYIALWNIVNYYYINNMKKLATKFMKKWTINE